MSAEAFNSIGRAIKSAPVFLDPSAKRLATMEGPAGCNRTCDYCTVWQRWDPKTASTVEQTRSQIDWLNNQGYSILNYVGGEPFAPFQTREGITFTEHTRQVVSYAVEKGMVVWVTTNGDFVNEDVLRVAKEAGVSSITFSLHSLEEPAIRHITTVAKMANREGIPAVINVVFTNERAEIIPRLAASFAENGILFNTTITQEHGGGFSAIPSQSKIPTIEQQRQVFAHLVELKKAGFVTDNLNYLRHASDFPNNSWVCNPEKDAFIHIQAVGQGEIGICSEIQTPFKIDEVNLDEDKWRETKKAYVDNCSGCLYGCTFQSENPHIVGDIKTFAMMGLIRIGQGALVEKLGKRTVSKLRMKDPEIWAPLVF
jgi:MoaA/NifB/PqqE/SkfB family radical SAM enzyme